jgi:signal transduction histidine kinase
VFFKVFNLKVVAADIVAKDTRSLIDTQVSEFDPDQAMRHQMKGQLPQVINRLGEADEIVADNIKNAQNELQELNSKFIDIKYIEDLARLFQKLQLTLEDTSPEEFNSDIKRFLLGIEKMFNMRAEVLDKEHRVLRLVRFFEEVAEYIEIIKGYREEEIKDSNLKLKSEELKTKLLKMNSYVQEFQENNFLIGNFYSSKLNELNSNTSLQRKNQITKSIMTDVNNIFQIMRRFSLQSMKVKELRPQTFLEKIKKNAEQQHPEYDVENNIKIRIEDDNPIFADEVYLTEAFRCLVNNAIRATMESGSEQQIILHSRAILDQRGNEWHRFSVQDNGVGILKDHLKTIFDAGFTTKDKEEGGGLGVPLALRIAKMHAGTLEVESLENEGTTFNFDVPTDFRQKLQIIKKKRFNNISDMFLLFRGKAKQLKILSYLDRNFEIKGSLVYRVDNTNPDNPKLTIAEGSNTGIFDTHLNRIPEKKVFEAQGARKLAVSRRLNKSSDIIFASGAHNEGSMVYLPVTDEFGEVRLLIAIYGKHLRSPTNEIIEAEGHKLPRVLNKFNEWYFSDISEAIMRDIVMRSLEQMEPKLFFESTSQELYNELLIKFQEEIFLNREIYYGKGPDFRKRVVENDVFKIIIPCKTILDKVYSENRRVYVEKVEKDMLKSLVPEMPRERPQTAAEVKSYEKARNEYLKTRERHEVEHWPMLPELPAEPAVFDFGLTFNSSRDTQWPDRLKASLPLTQIKELNSSKRTGTLYESLFTEEQILETVPGIENKLGEYFIRKKGRSRFLILRDELSIMSRDELFAKVDAHFSEKKYGEQNQIFKEILNKVLDQLYKVNYDGRKQELIIEINGKKVFNNGLFFNFAFGSSFEKSGKQGEYVFGMNGHEVLGPILLFDLKTAEKRRIVYKKLVNEALETKKEFFEKLPEGMLHDIRYYFLTNLNVFNGELKEEDFTDENIIRRFARVGVKIKRAKKGLKEEFNGFLVDLFKYACYINRYLSVLNKSDVDKSELATLYLETQEIIAKINDKKVKEGTFVIKNNSDPGMLLIYPEAEYSEAAVEKVYSIISREKKVSRIAARRVKSLSGNRVAVYYKLRTLEGEKLENDVLGAIAAAFNETLKTEGQRKEVNMMDIAMTGEMPKVLSLNINKDNLGRFFTNFKPHWQTFLLQKPICPISIKELPEEIRESEKLIQVFFDYVDTETLVLRKNVEYLLKSAKKLKVSKKTRQELVRIIENDIELTLMRINDWSAQEMFWQEEVFQFNPDFRNVGMMNFVFTQQPKSIMYAEDAWQKINTTSLLVPEQVLSAYNMLVKKKGSNPPIVFKGPLSLRDIKGSLNNENVLKKYFTDPAQNDLSLKAEKGEDVRDNFLRLIDKANQEFRDDIVTNAFVKLYLFQAYMHDWLDDVKKARSWPLLWASWSDSNSKRKEIVAVNMQEDEMIAYFENSLVNGGMFDFVKMKEARFLKAGVVQKWRLPAEIQKNKKVLKQFFNNPESDNLILRSRKNLLKRLGRFAAAKKADLSAEYKEFLFQMEHADVGFITKKDLPKEIQEEKIILNKLFNNSYNDYYLLKDNYTIIDYLNILADTKLIPVSAETREVLEFLIRNLYSFKKEIRIKIV